MTIGVKDWMDFNEIYYYRIYIKQHLHLFFNNPLGLVLKEKTRKRKRESK